MPAPASRTSVGTPARSTRAGRDLAREARERIVDLDQARRLRTGWTTPPGSSQSTGRASVPRRRGRTSASAGRRNRSARPRRASTRNEVEPEESAVGIDGCSDVSVSRIGHAAFVGRAPGLVAGADREGPAVGGDAIDAQASVGRVRASRRRAATGRSAWSPADPSTSIGTRPSGSTERIFSTRPCPSGTTSGNANGRPGSAAPPRSKAEPGSPQIGPVGADRPGRQLAADVGGLRERLTDELDLRPRGPGCREPEIDDVDRAARGLIADRRVQLDPVAADAKPALEVDADPRRRGGPRDGRGLTRRLDPVDPPVDRRRRLPEAGSTSRTVADSTEGRVAETRVRVRASSVDARPPRPGDGHAVAPSLREGEVGRHEHLAAEDDLPRAARDLQELQMDAIVPRPGQAHQSVGGDVVEDQAFRQIDVEAGGGAGDVLERGVEREVDPALAEFEPGVGGDGLASRDRPSVGLGPAYPGR